MRSSKFAAFLLLPVYLWSQDSFLVPGKGQISCPLVVGDNTLGDRISGPVANIPRPASIKTLTIKGVPSSEISLKILEPMQIEPSLRPKLENLSVIDLQGNKTFLRDKLGKVIIIGFWHTACEPSIQWLQEMAALQEKEEKFGFIAYPVNVDSNQAGSVKNFLQLNKSILGSMRVYRAGIGKEGYLSVIEPLPAVPTILFIDRQGRVARILVGFERGSTVKSLKTLLTEPTPVP